MTSTAPFTVRKLSLNQQGRDFVVGDIHGCYDLVLDALREAGFNTRRDRLLSLGDTVDRGPDSPRALAFLRQPWVHAVRGNHEDMFLELYAEDGVPPHPHAVEFITGRNGMGWWRDLSEGMRDDMIAEFRKMPVSIEVETARGTVGLVHADVPDGLSWHEFTRAVENGDTNVVHRAVWGRDRISSKDTSGVQGIGRVFVGHTPVSGARRLGNVYHVDTGAVFGVLRGGPEHGHLTLAHVACGTGIFDADTLSEATRAVNVLGANEDTPDRPFGAYAGM